MRKILERTISSCGVQVKNAPSNVSLEDRYGALIFFYLMRFYVVVLDAVPSPSSRHQLCGRRQTKSER